MHDRVRTALVGREDALRAFEHAVSAVCADGFRFVAVVGDPGMGKSRLLAELARITGRS